LYLAIERPPFSVSRKTFGSNFASGLGRRPRVRFLLEFNVFSPGVQS
jgi:hypothetical protein